MNNYHTIIQNIFKEYEVKDAFNSRIKVKVDSTADQKEKEKTFWQVYKEFVSECGMQNDWTDATFEKFAAVKNHIKEFNSHPTFALFNEKGWISCERNRRCVTALLKSR